MSRGVKCPLCRDEGPDLRLSTEDPQPPRWIGVGVEFTCGGCHRRWRSWARRWPIFGWRFSGVREVRDAEASRGQREVSS